MIGSLFTGIGGLDLAVEDVFGGPTLWQIDNDPTARAVLAHHWPEAIQPAPGDVTTINPVAGSHANPSQPPAAAKAPPTPGGYGPPSLIGSTF